MRRTITRNAAVSLIFLAFSCMGPYIKPHAPPKLDYKKLCPVDRMFVKSASCNKWLKGSAVCDAEKLTKACLNYYHKTAQAAIQVAGMNADIAKQNYCGFACEVKKLRDYGALGALLIILIGLGIAL